MILCNWKTFSVPNFFNACTPLDVAVHVDAAPVTPTSLKQICLLKRNMRTQCNDFVRGATGYAKTHPEDSRSKQGLLLHSQDTIPFGHKPGSVWDVLLSLEHVSC